MARKSGKSKAKDKSARSQGDALANYRAHVKTVFKDNGAVEILTLADDDCMALIRGSVSTRSLALDNLLNGVGVPLGRIVEIFGPNHIGKSTLLDSIFAQVQTDGGIAILADTENSRDPKYMQAIGVDLTSLQYLHFPNMTPAETVLESIIETANYWKTEYPDTPVIIGWDSLGGTSTAEELAKKIGERTVASMASVMRQACRKLPAVLAGSKVGLVVLNHEYQLVDGNPYKKKETYGGEAVRLAATIRLELFNKGMLKASTGEQVGRQVGARLHKNRLGNPFADTVIAVLPNRGIDNTWTVYEGLKDKGVIIQKGGGWAQTTLAGLEYKFQGWSGFRNLIAEKPELWAEAVELWR